MVCSRVSLDFVFFLPTVPSFLDLEAGNGERFLSVLDPDPTDS
jgi:hypothetical protein